MWRRRRWRVLAAPNLVQRGQLVVRSRVGVAVQPCQHLARRALHRARLVEAIRHVHILAVARHKTFMTAAARSVDARQSRLHLVATRSTSLAKKHFRRLWALGDRFRLLFINLAAKTAD